MIKIAVLIPTFKPGLYLEECLRCFEVQTLSKEYFEVHIVLNGPGGYFLDYINELSKKFTFAMKYSYIPESGVSNARNFLIENSKSEYIAFVDDDDLVTTNYLEMLLAVSNEKFMGISNVADFEQEVSKTTESYIGRCFNSISASETSKFLTRKYYSSPVAKLLHRSMILDCRFDTNLAIGEDSLFMAKISNKISGVAKAENNPTYFVRQRVGSATRSQVRRTKECKRIAYLLLIYLKMLFSFKYDSIFILTRIFATMLHLKRVF